MRRQCHKQASSLALWSPVLAFVVSCGSSERPSAPSEAPSVAPNPASVRSSALARGSLDAALTAARQAEGRGDARYRFARAASGFASSASAAGLRTVAEANGFTVSRTDDGVAARLATVHASCDGRAIPVGEGAPALDARDTNVVIRARTIGAARVDEWIENGPLGLEHGWTLASSPCDDAGASLTLSVASAGLSPREASGAIELVDATGRARLRYGKLYAEDAQHRPLPARMSVVDGAIAVVVDVRGASWPVLVDPLVTTAEPRITAADGAAQDQLGAAVAVEADTALVGAPYRADGGVAAGAVYVFTRSAGVWSQQAVIAPSDAAAGDLFGASVSLSGDLAAIGSPGRDDGEGAGQGVAYVYKRTGATWTLQDDRLDAVSPAAGDAFGTTVALKGTTLVVGAPGKTVGGRTKEGEAFVFDGSKGWLVTGSVIKSSVEAADDNFGAALAFDGTTIVVGAPGKDWGVNVNQGAAFAYVAATGGGWAPRGSIIVAPGGGADEAFGSAVGIAGGTLLIGAPGASVSGKAAQGAAYEFGYNGTAWVQLSLPFSASDGESNGQFGAAIAVSAPVAVIGAPGKTVGTQLAQGGAYLFLHGAVGWTQQGSALVGNDGLAGDRYGSSVAISPASVLVGARSHRVGLSNAQGSAYPYAVAGLQGTPCTSVADCATGLACNSGHCSTQCHACTDATAASCTPLNGTACDDGDACTRTDVCSNGVCIGKNANPCECKTGGVCDPKTGACSGPSVTDGTVCLGGWCVGGVCELLDAGVDSGADVDPGKDAGKDAASDALDSTIDGASDAFTDAADATDSADADGTTDAPPSDSTSDDAADSAADAAADAPVDSTTTDAVADTDVPLPPPKGDSGCSCDAPGAQATRSYGALAALGLALGLARRRRAR